MENAKADESNVKGQLTKADINLSKLAFLTCPQLWKA